MRIIVIEDFVQELRLIRSALKKAYPEAQVVASQPSKSWDEAFELIERESCGDEGEVLILDLALGDHGARSAWDRADMVEQAAQLRPKATLIAFTTFVKVLEGHEAGGWFHGAIDKVVLSNPGLNSSGRCIYVRDSIAAALARQSSKGKDVVTFSDSAGMRTALLAYGSDVIQRLIAFECVGWTHISVEALSGGYSGSSILEIHGLRSQAPQHVVVKIARDRHILEDEARALDTYRSEVSAWEVRIAWPGALKRVHGYDAYYSVQETIAGCVLYDLLHDTPAALTAVRRMMTIAPRMNAVKWEGQSRDNIRAFTMTDIDIDRARHSMKFLKDAASVLDQRGQWPERVCPVDTLFDCTSVLLSRWSGLARRCGKLEWSLQHGDLNPKNIVVGHDGSLCLIDLQRMRHWPVGYDLVRLCIQLKVRGVDSAQGKDWVWNGLTDWAAEPLLHYPPRSGGEVLSRPAWECERALGELVGGCDRKRRGVLLAAVFDLLRILSYGDLSPFKRLWAAVSLDTIGRELLQLIGSPKAE